MDVAELQALIESTRADRGFTTDPLQIMTLLTEEVGEVAGEIKKTWSPNYAEFDPHDLANELADTFVLLSALASCFEIDVETAIQAKFIEVDGARHWASANPNTTPELPPR